MPNCQIAINNFGQIAQVFLFFCFKKNFWLSLNPVHAFNLLILVILKFQFDNYFK